MDDIKPDYYYTSQIDVIKGIELLKGKDSAKDFCVGNVIKYVIRYQNKNGIEDLNKAKTYLNRLIEMENEDERK